VNQSLLFKQTHVFQCALASQATGYAKNGKDWALRTFDAKNETIVSIDALLRNYYNLDGFFWDFGLVKVIIDQF
jgi:hypothetical protein